MPHSWHLKSYLGIGVNQLHIVMAERALKGVNVCLGNCPVYVYVRLALVIGALELIAWH